MSVPNPIPWSPERSMANDLTTRARRARHQRLLSGEGDPGVPDQCHHFGSHRQLSAGDPSPLGGSRLVSAVAVHDHLAAHQPFYRDVVTPGSEANALALIRSNAFAVFNQAHDGP